MNTEGDFKAMVSGLRKSGEVILSELTAKDVDLQHMAIGICGEAGELADAIKKITIYRKPADLKNVIEELGDLEFYMEGVRQIFGITRERTLAENMDKLGKR